MPTPKGAAKALTASDNPINGPCERHRSPILSWAEETRSVDHDNPHSRQNSKSEDEHRDPIKHLTLP